MDGFYLILLLGIIILLCPVFIMRRIAKKWFPSWKTTATGIAFGLMAMPISFWVAGISHNIPGCSVFFASFLNGVHMWPFFKFTFLKEIIDVCRGTMGNHDAYIAIGGVFWAIIYGAIGAAIDVLLIWKRETKARAGL